MNKIYSFTIAALSLCLFSSTSLAGFEWTPPPAVSKAPVKVDDFQPSLAPDGSFQGEAVPAAPVMAEPISPFPIPVSPLPGMAPSEPPAQDLVINPYPLNAGQQTSGSGDSASLLQEMLKESGQINPLPNPAKDIQKAQAMKSASSPVKKAIYPDIQGFGRDIPLAIALSQVLPADFTFSFAQGVNAGQSVSWQGGRSWDSVMNDMLAPVGLYGEINGRAVVVREGVAPRQNFSSPVFAEPSNDVVQAVPLPPFTQEAGAENTSMISRSSEIMPVPADDGPKMAARISRADDMGTIWKGDSNDGDMPMQQEVLSEPLSPPVSVLPQGLEEVSDVNEMPQSADEIMSQSLTREVDTGMSVPPMQGSKDDKWGEPQKTMKMASVPSLSAGMDADQTWRAVRGDSLRTILSDWADDAGVELYWSSEYDYPLDSSVRFTGTFEQAVQNLLTGLRDARPRPVGRLHPNLPEGPPVLIIETQQVIQ